VLYQQLQISLPHCVLSAHLTAALQAEWDSSVDALHSSLSFVPPPHYRCISPRPPPPIARRCRCVMVP
jgi:hypothetical protein